MADNNNIKKPSLEEVYQIKPTDVHVDEEGRYTTRINVMSEVLGGKKSLLDIYSGSGRNAEFIIDETPDYYIKKYSKEANPLDDNALPAKDIVGLMKHVKTNHVKYLQAKENPYFGEEIFNMKKRDPNNGLGLRITDAYGGNVRDFQKGYEGFYRSTQNSKVDLGTREELAMENSKMLRNGKYIDNPGEKELDRLYGGGKNVIRTTIDPSTQRSIFEVLDNDAFVPAEQQYSTKWGPKKTYNTGWGDSWRSLYASATAGTMKTFSDIGTLVNSTFNYNEDYMFRKGADFVDDHLEMVIDASIKNGNLDQAERIVKARDEMDPEAIKAALNDAYSYLPTELSQSFRHRAQPLKYSEWDKSIQATFNMYNQLDYKQSLSTEEGKGMFNWMARNTPTIGYMIPQIAVGMASGGASAYASGAASLAGKLALKEGIQNAIKYTSAVLVNSLGTSQAFSSFARTAQENGVSPENIAKYGWLALPLTFATEHVTNKWVGEQFNPSLFGKAMREVYAPAAKKMAEKQAKGELTDKAIKDIVVDNYRKVFDSKFIRSVVEGDGYLANIAKANISEGFQENLEQELYNGFQRIINDAAPEYSTEGHGKVGGVGLFEQTKETTLGTFFATSVITAITGIVPKVVRKATGQPEPDSRKESLEMVKWDVLRNGASGVIDQAKKEIKKNVSVFGNKNIKAKDAFVDGSFDPKMMVVPKSDLLQSMGYAEGQEIDNFAEMHFVELMEQVEAWDKINKSMGLNDLDRQILSSAGFNEEISLNKAADAFTSVVDAKEALESFVGDPIDENMTEENKKAISEKNDKARQPLLDNYNQAVENLKYYTAIEKGTNNSQAANDLVKRNTAIMNQLAERIKIAENLEKIDPQLKNNKDFSAKYAQHWENLIEEQYTYDTFRKFYEDIKKANLKAVEDRENTIKAIDGNTKFAERKQELEQLSAKFESTLEKKDNKELRSVMKEFSNFSRSFAEDLTLADTLISMDDLNTLKDQYANLYDQSLKAFQILRPEITSKFKDMARSQSSIIQDYDETLESAEQEKLLKIDQLQQQINELESTSSEDMTPEQIALKDEALTSLKSQHEELLSAPKNNVITKEEYEREVERINSGNLTEEETGSDYDLYSQLVDSAGEYLSTIDNVTELPYLFDSSNQRMPYREETKEQFNQRVAELKKKIEEDSTRSYIMNYFVNMNKGLERALKFVESINRNDESIFTEAYPNDNYKDTNWMDDINIRIAEIEQIKPLINAFSVARALHGRDNFNKHSSAEEKSFVAEFTKLNEEGKNDAETLFNNSISMASELSRQKGDAELAFNKKRLHTATVINQNKRDSVKALIYANMKDDNGNPLIDSELSNRFIEVGDVPKRILDLKGQYTEEEMKAVAIIKSATDDILSLLQSKQTLVTNEKNIKLFFEPFIKLAENNKTSTGQIFQSDDSASHIGETSGETNRTRESFIENPLFQFDGENGTWSFEERLKTREDGSEYKSVPSYSHTATQLREHFNVLSSIISKYSVNQLNALRKVYFEREEDIETGEQEQVVNSIVSFFTASASNNALALLWKTLDGANVYSSENTAKSIKNYFTNALTVGGDYGVGKTQFVLVRALQLINDLEAKDTNKSVKNTVFVSMTERLKKVHEATFKQKDAKFMSLKKDFLDNLNKLDIDSSMIYVIDEASIISDAEFSKIRDRFHNAGAKVLFLGDTFQMRDRSTSSRTPDVMYRTMTTHLMTEQFSSNSSLLNSLASNTRKTIANAMANPIIVFNDVAEDTSGNVKLGARFFGSQIEVWNSFAQNIDTHPDKAIIFSDEAHFQKFKNENKAIAGDIEKQYKAGKVFFAFRETNGETERLIQGLREKEVYIAFSQYDTAEVLGSNSVLKTSLMASALYTSIGRASKWVGLLGNKQEANTKNKTISEVESIGGVIDNNEFNKAVKKNLSLLYKVYFDTIDNPVEETKEKTTKLFSGVLKVADSDGIYNDVEYTYEIFDDVVTVRFNNKEVSIPYSNENDYDSTKSMVIDYIKSEMKSVYDEEGSVPEEEEIPTTSDGFEVAEDDDIESEDVEGTILSTDPVSANIITPENKVTSVSLAKAKIRKENTDDDDKRNEVEVSATRSSKRFASNKNKTIVWGSSASVVDSSLSTEDQRMINDILVSDSTGLEFRVRKVKNATIINQDGVNEKRDVVAVEVVFNFDKESTRKVLADKFAGTPFESKFNSLSGLTVEKQIKKMFGIKGNTLTVGTISEPRVPVIIKANEFKNASDLTVDQIREQWELFISEYSSKPNYKKDVVENYTNQMNYNIELRNLMDMDNYSATISPVKRKINYDKDVHIPLTELLKSLPKYEIDAAPVYNGNHRMTVGITVGKEKFTVVVTMPKLKNNKKASDKLRSILNSKESTSAFSDLSSLETNDSKTEISKLFVKTPLYKFLRANSSIILKNNDDVSKRLREHYFIFQPDKKRPNRIWINFNVEYRDPIKLKNDITKMYLDAINEISLKLESSPYYDYLEKGNNGFKTHDNSPIHDSLMVHANRINNIQMDVYIDKKQVIEPVIKVATEVNPDTRTMLKELRYTDSQINNLLQKQRESIITNGITADEFYKAKKRKGNSDVMNSLELVDVADTEMVKLEYAIEQVRKYLGNNYVDSEYFLINNGYIMHDGKYAAGMVSNNSILSLAQLDGMVHRSTARHEVYHIVFKNFTKPEIQDSLKRAARKIAKKEGYRNIAGNEEEWLANDFAKKGKMRNIESYGQVVDQADVSLWERFKTFVRGLVDRLTGVYKANKRLVEQYNKIENGEYVNRTEQLRTDAHADTSYEDAIPLQEPVQVKTDLSINIESSLLAATDIKSELSRTLKSSQSLVIAQRNIAMSLIQNTNYGNKASNISKSLGDSIQNIQNSRIAKMNSYGKKEVEINLGDGVTVMTIAEAVEKGYENNIAASSSSESNKFIGLYKIYSSDKNVMALVQLALPRLDIINGYLDESFAVNEQYDWSHISPDHYINSIQKLYLSNIPRIDALGEIGGSSLTLNYGTVSSIMKKIGSLARVEAKSQNIDTITAFKNIMIDIINEGTVKATLHEDGHFNTARFNDEFTENVHSIYNYIFGPYTQPYYQNDFYLNYSNIDGNENQDEDYVGLEQKASIIYDRILNNQFNGYSKTEMLDAYYDIQEFINSMIGLFSSYYTKEQVKHVYNNGSMSSINYQNENWKETSRTIQNIQLSNINNGQLSGGLKHFMKYNSLLIGDDIKMKISNHDDELFSVMRMQDGKYILVNDLGSGVNLIGYNDDPMQYFEENYSNFIAAYENSYVKLGLGSLQPETMKLIMTAREWSDITDTMREVDGVVGNFNGKIKDEYDSPAEWFVDYFGTLIKMYSLYGNTDYYTVKSNGTTTYKEYHDLIEEVRSRSGSLSEKIKSVDPIVHGFVERTSPFNTFDIKYWGEDAAEGVDESDSMDSEAVRFILPSDMWVSANLLASIIDKTHQNSDDKMIVNAAGSRTYNTGTTSYLQESLEKYNIFDNKDEATVITGIVSALGVSRDMSYVTTGKNKLDTIDFIGTSIEYFMHQLWQTSENPVMNVPAIPTSDTGNVLYIKMKSDIIDTRNKSFSINYSVVADEMLREYNKIQNRYKKSRKNLDNTVKRIVEAGFLFDASYKDIRKSFIKVSMDAIESGRYNELRRIIDSSDLIKDLSGGEFNMEDQTPSNFDIGFKTIEKDGVEYKIAIPGKYLYGKFQGYDHFFGSKIQRTDVKGIKRHLSAIEMLEHVTKNPELYEDSKKEQKDIIYSMFKKDFKEFAKQLREYNYKQSNTVHGLNKRVGSNDMIYKDNNRKLQDTDSYYYENGKKFVPQQPLFAFYLGTIIGNNHLDDITIDNLSFKSYFEKVKRNGPVITPGVNLVVARKNNEGAYVGTVPTKTRAAYYYDKFVDGGMVYNEKNELVNAGKANTEDGQHYVSPLFQEFIKVSIGGSKNTIMGTASAYKAINNQKREDGTFSQIKRADKVITGFDMQSRSYRNMFNRMMVDSDRAIAATGLFDSPTILMDKYKELFNSYDPERGHVRTFEDVMKDMHSWIVEIQYEAGKLTKNGIKKYEAITNNLVGYIGSVSVQKGAVTKINEYDHLNDDLSTELAYEEVDNNYTKMVMNASQKDDTNKLQAFPNQQESFFGVTDNKKIKTKYNEMLRLKGELQKSLKDELYQEISKEKGPNGDKVIKGSRFSDINWNDALAALSSNDEAKIDSIKSALFQMKSFIRKNIIKDLSNSSEDLAYIKLFEDFDISENLPMMRQKFVQKSINLINKTIQARTTGLRVTQMTGEYIDLFEKNGMTYTYNDAINEIYGDASELSFDEYNSLDTYNEILANGFTESKITDMQIKEGKTVAGTVVMSNILKDKYGHRDNESMIDIMTIAIDDETVPILKRTKPVFIWQMTNLSNNGEKSIDFLTTIANHPMGRKAISNLDVLSVLNEKIAKYNEDPTVIVGYDYDDYYNKFNRVIGKRADKMVDLEKVTADRVLKYMYDNDLMDMPDDQKAALMLYYNKEMLDDVLSEMYTLTETFNDTFTMLLSRVPATFLGSGGVYKNVAFHNDGNVVYIPASMTVRNDADFDIDALTAYVDSIDEYGHKTERKSGAIRNELNKLRNEMFLHEDNQTSIFLKSSIEDIKNSIKKKTAKEYLNNSLVTINTAYKRNKAGADSIGITANSLSAISYVLSFRNNINFNGNLKSIIEYNSPKGKLIQGLDGIITKLGTWLQTALDNAKNNSLGDYNVTELTVNILAVLKMNGLTNSEVYDMFNNDFIESLFNRYSSKSSILTKSSDFDLFAMAEEEIIKLGSKITNAKLNHYHEIVTKEAADKKLSYSSGKELYEKTEIESELIYDKLVKDITPLIMKITKPLQRQIAEYYSEGTNEESETRRWLEDNKISIRSITQNRGEILLDESEWIAGKLGGGFVSSTESLRKEITKSINAIAQLGNLNALAEGYHYVSMLPKATITADTLYRLSAILKLRNGLPTMDNDFFRSKNEIELSLGMPMSEFLKLKRDPLSKYTTTDIDAHIAYFKANNDYYNSLDQNDPEEAKKKEIMIRKERLIIDEMNLSLFVASIPQLKNVIEQFEEQSKLKEILFIKDKPILRKLGKELLALQNRVNFKFDNELALFDNAVTNLVLDHYFNIASESERMVYRPINPILTHIGWQNINGKIDLSNNFSREEFISGFSSYIMDIIAHKRDINYLRTLFPASSNVSDDILFDMEDNQFLNSLVIRGRYKELAVNFSGKNMSEILVTKLRDQFSQLPLDLRNMFINYEIIQRHLNYKKGGIMEVIGIDFYKGNISKAFEDVNNALNKTNSLDAFIPETIKNSFEDDVKERFFDYMGANQNIAEYMKLPFDKGLLIKPKYVYNSGATTIKGSKRVVYYKLNENGNYEEMHKLTNSVSLQPALNTMSLVPTVKLDAIQMLELESTDYVTVPGQHTLYKIAVGDYRQTNNGVLVRVVSVTPNSYKVVKATNEVDLMMEKLNESNQINNDRISLTAGSLQERILSNNFEINIEGKSKLLSDVVLNTIDKNGKKVTIRVFDKKKTYKTIDDILFAIKETAVLSVSSKLDYFNKANIFKDMTESQYRGYVETVANGLLSDTGITFSEHYTGNELAIMKDQASVALINIAYRSMNVLKNVIKNNIDAYVGNSKEKLEEVRMMMGPYTALDKTLEEKRVGMSTYASVARDAMRAYFNNEPTEMRQAETKAISQLGTFETSKSLFLETESKIREYIKTKQYNYNTLLTEDLVESIEEMKNLISLHPSKKYYQLSNKMNLFRLSNITSFISDVFTGKQSLYQKRTYDFRMPDFKSKKEEKKYLKDKEELDNIFAIGTEVDTIARQFFAEWSRQKNAGIENPVIPDYAASLVDTVSLMNVLNTYARAIDNYASINGYDYEFLTDDAIVYDNSKGELISKYVGQLDENGNELEMSGVATAHDLLLRFKLKGDNKYQDILLDFKTIRAIKNGEELFTDITEPVNDNDIDSNYRKGRNLSWKIQTEINRRLFNKVHGASISKTGILGFTKIVKDGKITIAIPSNIMASIEKNSEPWHDVSMKKGDAQLKRLINIFTSYSKSNISLTENEADNSETLNMCNNN